MVVEVIVEVVVQVIFLSSVAADNPLMMEQLRAAISATLPVNDNIVTGKLDCTLSANFNQFLTNWTKFAILTINIIIKVSSQPSIYYDRREIPVANKLISQLY